jgi:hypothetical protein
MKEGINGKLNNKKDRSLLLKDLSIVVKRTEILSNLYIMSTPHLAQINRKGFPLCCYEKNKACLSLCLISGRGRQPSRRKEETPETRIRVYYTFIVRPAMFVFY